MTTATLLAAGTTAVTSSNFTVAAGQPVRVAMTATSTTGRMTVFNVVTGVETLYATLTQSDPGVTISAPGTYRVKRPVLAVAAGVEVSTLVENHAESEVSATTGQAVGLVDPTTGGVLKCGAGQRMVGADLEQPIEIIAPVKKFGKLAARFGSGQWTAVTGSPVLTQGYMGYDANGVKTGVVSRTGMPDMLKAVPASNSDEGIQIGSFASNFLTKSLAGKIGLWVYVDKLPGYGVAETANGSIAITLSTNAGTTSNALAVSFNANQVREGWNFLKFVQRNPAAYTPGSGATEYHPFGVSCTGYGTGADSNVVDTDVARAKIGWKNMMGATLYFDSLWTDFDSTAQAVLGCDGGLNFTEIAIPKFSSFGWVGYTAFPYNTVDSGTANNTIQPSLSANAYSAGAAAAAKGWDVINHSLTHPSLGSYLNASDIAYQLLQSKSWLIEMGYTKGCEFYASPQSSSSRLSDKVIKDIGFKLQRHARKWNCSVTPYGIDNPQQVGSIDMGSATSGGVSGVTGGATISVSGWQKASKIKVAVDVACDYGDCVWLFWHGITTLGDTGSGEDLTGDNLLLTSSSFRSVLDYIRQKEVAGLMTIPKGITGFWYGG